MKPPVSVPLRALALLPLLAMLAGCSILGGKSRDIEAIVVSEIPYQVNKARLVERIAELVNEKTIEGIARIRDESDRKGMRIVIFCFECKEKCPFGVYQFAAVDE